MFELFSVSIVSSIFLELPLVGFVDVRRILLGKEISYSKIFKTAPLDIFSPAVIKKYSVKGENTNLKST